MVKYRHRRSPKWPLHPRRFQPPRGQSQSPSGHPLAEARVCPDELPLEKQCGKGRPAGGPSHSGRPPAGPRPGARTSMHTIVANFWFSHFLCMISTFMQTYTINVGTRFSFRWSNPIFTHGMPRSPFTTPVCNDELGGILILQCPILTFSSSSRI